MVLKLASCSNACAGTPRSLWPRYYRHGVSRTPLLRRSLIAAPRPNSGPLMERRSDRALPPIPQPWKVWAKTMPIFIVLITISALGIFNYQKQSSSVVASTLYALRTSELGRQILGDEIYFRDRFPWIWGEMNQLHGRIDIEYGVKGTKSSGMMRFRSVRKRRMGLVSHFYLSNIMISSDELLNVV